MELNLSASTESSLADLIRGRVEHTDARKEGDDALLAA